MRIVIHIQWIFFTFQCLQAKHSKRKTDKNNGQQTKRWQMFATKKCAFATKKCASVTFLKPLFFERLEKMTLQNSPGIMQASYTDNFFSNHFMTPTTFPTN